MGKFNTSKFNNTWSWLFWITPNKVLKVEQMFQTS